MISTPIDHKDKAEGRLATQYRDSVRLISYIKSLLKEADTLESVFKDLIEKRWIDTAQGANLDILGSIVGQSRELVQAEIFDYFGFAGNPQSQSFGTVKDLSVGGRFRFAREPTQGIRRLEDDEYRLFIRARIIRNKTNSTPEEIISQLQYLFNASYIIYSEGKAFYQLAIGRRLSLNEKSVLKNTNIIPKTAGVRASYTTEFNGENFFSFKGVPGSSGFGSINNSELGGSFGNLIL